MATKLICDRCKKEITGVHIRLVSRIPSKSARVASTIRFSVDLCMDCEILVRSFVEYPKDGLWIQKCSLQTEVITPDRRFKFPLEES